MDHKYDILYSLPEDVTARWKPTMMYIMYSCPRNPSTVSFDSSVVHNCAIDFLDTNDPSRFVIGIAIRLWYSWWHILLQNSKTTSERIGSYNTTALLHQIIRGHLTQHEKEYHILSYLASTTCKYRPDTASAAALHLLEECIHRVGLTRVVGVDTAFLDEYVQARFSGHCHTMVFSRILPPETSILSFFYDILHVLEDVDDCLEETLDIHKTLQPLLPHTQLLRYTVEVIGTAFNPLAKELLDSILNGMILWCLSNVFSHGGIIVMMSLQLSHDPASTTPLMLFRQAFRKFVSHFRKTVGELRSSVFLAMEVGILKQKGFIHEHAAVKFHYTYQHLLGLRNRLCVLLSGATQNSLHVT